MNENYHIIGCGIAGITLAWKLFDNKTPFVLYDSGENHSSSVAAGLVNPVVFKRLTKSWLAENLIPEANSFYSKVEKRLGISLISNLEINRIFSDLEEKNNWTSKQITNPFLGDVKENPNKNFNAPFEVGSVLGMGSVDVKSYISASVNYFKNHDIISKGVFNYDEIDSDSTFIFCEGYEIINNPFFNYLPMKPTHGEILTIKSAQLNLHAVMNKNMFIMPLGDDLYKIGATYNWDLQEPKTTNEGKTELLDKLKAVSDFELEVIKHEAGIRPTVADRRPLLGAHPEHKNLLVFNGLGTKGVMLAPYFSNELIEFMLNKKPLNKEVSIERYERHSKPNMK